MTSVGREDRQPKAEDSFRNSHETSALANNTTQSSTRNTVMRDEKRERLDELVRANLTRMLQLAQRLTGDLDQAEEITAEAMFRAVRGWDSFRGDADSRTWLYTIVVNTFRNHLKRISRQKPIDDPPIDRSETPDESASRIELGQIVAKEVSKLPTKQREVLVLKTYENMNTEEISKVLNISTANVYTTLHHAREHLRKKLSHFISTEQSK